jgi:hypothetical protein
MKKQVLCQKCGGPRGESVHESLCQKCTKSLPHCYSCGIICGAEGWGYRVEKEAIPCILKKNGKKIILCGGCNQERFKKEKGYLILDKNEKILSEEIEVIKMKLNQ